ncbi:HEAT repeat domain-containing protein [Chitiniphilus eburneus]|uniref:HEAT repeat domain-containing protein n=1 Tax=Chitiniphilus eburneus TaxID=2571148 RepID=A0A4U0QDQ2_9NEIS|nr:HEAT repeat domain-containing protein [Chitiniphilus eburneus]TJZ78752.1 HEAT repeat domain-containing protein [Chitiniphilus eburneus]
MALIKTTSPLSPAPPPARDRLLDELRAVDAATRGCAAAALGSRGDAHAELLDAWDTEPDATVRLRLLTALATHPDEQVTQRLAQALRGADTVRRTELVDVLRELPGNAPAVVVLLDDPDPDLRIYALNALRMVPTPQALARVAQLLWDDPHVNVCGVAIEWLAEVGTPTQLPALHAVRARFPGVEFIGFAVDLAVARIGGHD